MIRVGIIGLGGIARSHAAAIAELDNVEIVAVADLFADKRAEFMEKWGWPRGTRRTLSCCRTPRWTPSPSPWGINCTTG